MGRKREPEEKFTASFCLQRLRTPDPRVSKYFRSWIPWSKKKGKWAPHSANNYIKILCWTVYPTDDAHAKQGHWKECDKNVKCTEILMFSSSTPVDHVTFSCFRTSGPNLRGWLARSSSHRMGGSIFRGKARNLGYNDREIFVLKLLPLLLPMILVCLFSGFLKPCFGQSRGPSKPKDYLFFSSSSLYPLPGMKQPQAVELVGIWKLALKVPGSYLAGVTRCR